MSSFSIWHWLIVLVIVVLTFGTKRFMRVHHDGLRSRRDRDMGRMPVYSTETTNGKEAEFIRDRLPDRIPPIVILAIVAAVCAVVWWLTRSR